MQPVEELELKTLLTRKDFEKLVAQFPGLSFVPQINIYYESRDSDHYAFRVRLRNGEKLFTLKHRASSKTMEYEKIFEGNLEDDEEIVNTLSEFNVTPPFKEIGQLITYRAVFDNGLAEMCFDINSYNDTIDYEIEYEVRKEHDHLTAFKELLLKAGIDFVPNKTSKYKRFMNSLNRSYFPGNKQ